MPLSMPRDWLSDRLKNVSILDLVASTIATLNHSNYGKRHTL